MTTPRLSSVCRCGPSGAAKHEVDQCPHLFHTCSPACGPNYSKHYGMYAARRLVGKLTSYDEVAPYPTPTSSPAVSSMPIKPPWEV